MACPRQRSGDWFSLIAVPSLNRRGDRADFSDLMQTLLDAWLDTAE